MPSASGSESGRGWARGRINRHEPPILPADFREIIGTAQSGESPTSRRHSAIGGSARHVDSKAMAPRQGHRDIARTPATRGGPSGASRPYPRLRGLGLHKNFIDRSGAVRSKGGPVGRGRMPGALTRASELSWDLVRRTPPVATRCSRSHIPGPPMHPGGSHVNRSEDGFSVIRPLWGCGRISAPSQLEKAYGCRPTTVIGTAHAAHREDSV